MLTDELINNNIQLCDINPNTLNYFSFENKRIVAKICDVYDGDTFSAIFYNENIPIKYRFRCLGYDAPEMKPLKSIAQREIIIEKAKQAKNKFIELVQKHPSKLVLLECDKFDKYGRILATVFNGVDEQSVNSIMIEQGYAKNYDGGTKSTDNF